MDHNTGDAVVDPKGVIGYQDIESESIETQKATSGKKYGHGKYSNPSRVVYSSSRSQPLQNIIHEMLHSIKLEIALGTSTEARFDLAAQKGLARIRDHLYEESLRSGDAELLERVEAHKRKELYLLRKVQKKNKFILKMQEIIEAEQKRAEESSWGAGRWQKEGS